MEMEYIFTIIHFTIVSLLSITIKFILAPYKKINQVLINKLTQIVISNHIWIHKTITTFVSIEQLSQIKIDFYQ